MTSDSQKDCDPCDVILEVNDQNDTKQELNDERKVKRIIHFSDGNLVEYEEKKKNVDTSEEQSQGVPIDPQNPVGWVPWTWNQTSWFSSKLIGSCDYVGEALANFLGITSPKYQFEIEEYNRIQKAEAEEKERDEMELAGWRERPENNLMKNETE